MTVIELWTAPGRLPSRLEVVIKINNIYSEPMGIIGVARGGVSGDRTAALGTEGEDPSDYPPDLHSCWHNPVALIRVDTLGQLAAWAAKGRS